MELHFSHPPSCCRCWGYEFGGCVRKGEGWSASALWSRKKPGEVVRGGGTHRRIPSAGGPSVWVCASDRAGELRGFLMQSRKKSVRERTVAADSGCVGYLAVLPAVTPLCGVDGGASGCMKQRTSTHPCRPFSPSRDERQRCSTRWRDEASRIRNACRVHHLFQRICVCEGLMEKDGRSNRARAGI